MKPQNEAPQQVYEESVRRSLKQREELTRLKRRIAAQRKALEKMGQVED